MAEISTYMSVLKYGDETPTNELKIKSFPSLLGKRNSLEVTDLSDDAQRFIPGIRSQSDSFEFTANYDATVYDTINKLTEVQKCSLTFSDKSGYTWDGYISASVNEGGVDAVIEMTIAITPTSVPVWTKGA